MPLCLCGQNRNLHHDLFDLPRDGMLHFFEIALHQIQTVDTGFEFARQFGEASSAGELSVAETQAVREFELLQIFR